MTDVSLFGALLAGLVSLLSPCVLSLVPGYVSMLSGIGMEQLRDGRRPRAGLLGPSRSSSRGFRWYSSPSARLLVRLDNSFGRIARYWLLSLAP